jgi:hypothetical protein
LPVEKDYLLALAATTLIPAAEAATSISWRRPAWVWFCEVAKLKDEAQRIAHALRRRYQAPERGVSSDRLAEQVRTMVRLKAAEIAFRELPRIAEHLPYEMRLLWAEVLRDCADALDRGRVYRPRQVVVVRRDGTRPLVDPAQAASHAVALTGVGD